MGLLNGLRLSLKNALRGNITVKYPYERLELPERARWAVRPTYFADGSPKCTACLTCVKTCPDHILSLDIETREDKTKHIVGFGYEVGACMMCGLCVEACPFDAIHMSHEYELAMTDPAGLKDHLLLDVDAATPSRHRQELEAATAACEIEAAADAGGPAAVSGTREGGEADE
jgi:NADH-quinone oxidoreductase subunit I